MMEKRIKASSRIISICLVLAMLLALVPVFPIAANAATTYSVKVYFKDTDGWGTVCGYAWDDSQNKLLGEWPGTQLNYDSSTGCYVLECSYTASTGTKFNFIFNNNNNGGQTSDLSVTHTQLASHQQWWVSGPSGAPAKMSMPVNNNGKVTFTYESSTASTVQLAGTMTGWSGVTMTESSNVFTYTCDLIPGAYEYKLIVDGSWINDPCNPYTTGTDNNNVFIVSGLQASTLSVVKGVATELPSVLNYTDASGNSSQKAVSYTVDSAYSSYATLSGNTLTVSSAYTGSTMTLTAATTDGETTTVTLNLVESASEIPTVKLHFVNTLGWQGVCAYAWSNATTSTFNAGTWPGKVVARDGVGIHTMEITHTPASGETLGVLFHNNNGAQTADVTISYAQLAAGSELWILPGATNDEGKYTCTVTDDASTLVYSPVVSGNQVTFKYSGSATSVYLAGSFNDWSSTATKMTKGSDGVWSVTMTLDAGVHEYKFVVDGTWTLDPLNGVVGGYDGNNIVVVPDDDTVEDGKIKVVLHFYRASGDYTGWDVWFWDNSTSSAASFSDDPVNKGKIATYYVDGISNSNVGYTVRKSDWSDKEFYDRFIDLSDVVGGTVHYFLNSGSESGSRVLGADAVNGAKITSASLDYSTGKLYTYMSMPVSGSVADAFGIYDASGADTDVAITSVNLENGQYVLTLNKKLGTNGLSNYKVTFNGTEGPVWVNTHNLFYNSDFNSDYNYTGDDLGATWSASSTTFKVWAPTAKHVQVLRYRGGNYGTDDWIETVDMTLGNQGVWSATVSGDLNGTYYNYLVHFDNYTVEATDPYAKSTGANGDRGMVLNMDSTDPVGWDGDVSPNQGMSYTDAIIYEMHVREFTIDENSGVTNKGKYLGLTEAGTNYNGYSTGLAHLKELGITHVQLMPVYDYNSVDEYHLTDWAQYAWGYDPKNYNVPEGSYSTDPFNGEVRVTEFKQMVQTLHRNGINVVMDVVYNHAFDGGNFCYNKIVPNYFSRFAGEGNWSNGSGVGNDMATERVMARNYIVDSILHWVEEYHIDGFRFDLAGLIDNTTINEIVNTVHAKYPNVIFYGEGWAPGDTAEEYGTTLTTKDNAWTVPGFGFFNDNFRNDIAGNNGGSWGFATGDTGKADAIASYFRASNGWSNTPTQTINYVSCHDNYSLMDKIIISKNGTAWYDMVKMNNLSAAIYMLAQGVPFIYSGEELLREKTDGNGNRYDNAYGTDDYINKLRWSDLENKTYCQMTDDYYAGLVAFRKNHAALRCPGGADAWNYTSYYKINDQTIMFYNTGYPNYECSDGIVIIYNASTSTQWVNLYDYGIPSGTWSACIHGDKAGTSALWTMDVTDSSGSVGVDPLSTTVLVLGDLIHEESVYNQNLSLVECKHTAHDTNGNCTTCGAAVGHSYTSVVTAPTCTASGYTTQSCSGCGSVKRTNATAALGHSYTGGSCTVPGTCSRCGAAEASAPGHTWGETCADAAACTVCGAVKVCFDNTTAAWETVNVYTWDADKNPCSGEWPGTAMTDEGDGIWSYVVDSVAEYVIFNDGSNQTDNLTLPTDGNNLYANGTWIPSDTSIHNWSSTVTDPTCAENGFTTYTCADCAISYVGDVTAALGHSWDETGETCTTCGAVKIYFDNSSASWTTVYIYTWDADGNVCSGYWPGYAMTDEGDGILSCGVNPDATSVIFSNENGEKTDDLTIPTDGSNLYVYAENTWKVYGECSHQYTSETTKEATCTEEGVLTYTCSLCGESYTESIPVADHSWDNGKASYESDCLNGGVMTYTCTVCGGTKTEEIPSQGCNLVLQDRYEPTCTEWGHSYSVCSVCGTGFEWGFQKPTGHSYTSTVTTAATCTEAGVMTYTCSACGDSYTEAIPAAGHSYSSVTTEPTCTEAGYTTYTCDTCGDSYTADQVPAIGHNYQGGVCANCGDGCAHSYDGGVETAAPTCTADGVLTYTCGICGTTKTEVVPSTGHSYNAATTAPTCNEAGFTTYTCSVCGDTYTSDETAALGHSYKAVVTAPTCDEAGFTTYTCSVCGDTYTADETEAAGHLYVDGVCENCGEAEPVKTQPTIQPLGPSLAFKEEIYYNIYFGVNNPDNVEITEMGVMTWTSAIDGTIETAEHVCPGTEPYYTTYFKARTQPISAKNMGEQLYIKIYLKLADGTYVYSSLLNYSARDYATNKLADESSSDGLKALCVALMNYGAAAQQYFGYKTDDLMNAGLTDEDLKYVSAYSDDMVPALVDAGTKDDALAWSGGYSALAPSVNFGGALGINYLFTPNKTMDGDMKLYVWTEADLEANDAMTLDNASQVITMTVAGDGMYSGRAGGISAKNAGDTIYACGVYYSNGVECRTGVLAYSVSAYCKTYANKESDPFQSMASLAAVYAYYANAYLGS